MRKDQVYLYTFLGLAVVTFVVGYFSLQLLMNYSTNQLLQSQIESSKREAKEVSNLVHYQLESGLSRQKVIENLQFSLEGTNTESGFVCMFDWSGIEICHPNPQKVGQQVLPGESFVQPVVYDEMAVEDFYELLKRGEATGGIRDFSNERKSEIIYLVPVKNTDWIVAAHANIDRIEGQIIQLKSNFMLVFSISGSLIVVISFFTSRYIGGLYEKDLETQNRSLSRELVSLSKLNQDVVKYKNKWNVAEDKNIEPIEHKKRIITYFKDQIVTIDTKEIAYVYIFNSITYIQCTNGDKFTSNQSLDELSYDLDNNQFFRANRQYILSIECIENIYKYGKHQLKIKVKPEAPDDIVISKNKASEFKQWLNS